MSKLTISLAQTLKAIKPYEHDKDFMEQVKNQERVIDEIDPKRLLSDMSELKKLEYIKLLKHKNDVVCFYLTAKGRDCQHNKVLNYLKVFGRYFFQLLIGASGGLAVLLIDHFLL